MLLCGLIGRAGGRSLSRSQVGVQLRLRKARRSDAGDRAGRVFIAIGLNRFQEPNETFAVPQ